MTEGWKDRTTEGQGESSIAPLFQSGAIKRPFIKVAIHVHTCWSYTAFNYARYWAPHKTHANVEKLKSAQNKHLRIKAFTRLKM